MTNGIDLIKDLWNSVHNSRSRLDWHVSDMGRRTRRDDVPVFEIVSRGGFERSQRRIWGRVTERHDTMLAYRDRLPVMGAHKLWAALFLSTRYAVWVTLRDPLIGTRYSIDIIDYPSCLRQD